MRYSTWHLSERADRKTLEPLEIGKGVAWSPWFKSRHAMFGVQLTEALLVAEKIDATVVDMRFVKPMDEALVREMADSHELLVTLEENAIMGGAGAGVSEFLARENVLKSVLHLGLPMCTSNTPNRARCWPSGLDAAGIEASVRQRMQLLGLGLHLHAAAGCDRARSTLHEQGPAGPIAKPAAAATGLIPRKP